MWFPTKRKVELEADRQLSRYESIQERLTVFTDQQKIVGSIFGPLPELTDMVIVCNGTYQDIFRTKAHIRFGTASLKEVVDQLSKTGKTAKNLESLLRVFEKARLQGRAAYANKFGKE